MKESLTDPLSLFATWQWKFHPCCTCPWTDCWEVSWMVWYYGNKALGRQRGKSWCWKGKLGQSCEEHWMPSQEIQRPNPQTVLSMTFSWYLSPPFTNTPHQHLGPTTPCPVSLLTLLRLQLCMGYCWLIFLPPSLPLGTLDSQTSVLSVVCQQHPPSRWIDGFTRCMKIQTSEGNGEGQPLQ